MPPPPTPLKPETVNNRDSEIAQIAASNEENKRRLETPLAAMLPSKYANVDVTELFPDFRHGKVSSLKISLYISFYITAFVVGVKVFTTIWTWKAKQFAKHMA